MEINDEVLVDPDFDFFEYQSELVQTHCGWGCHNVQQQANNDLLPIDF